VWRGRAREHAERQSDDKVSDDERRVVPVDNETVRQRMWKAFENPHTSTPALVFYYVTGYDISTVDSSSQFHYNSHCIASSSMALAVT